MSGTTRVLRRPARAVEASRLVGRGRQMREAFRVRDESHSQRHHFLDRVISVPGAIEGADPGDHLRHFDPQANVVSVLGDALDLQAPVHEVEQVGRPRLLAMGLAPPSA